MTTVDSKSIPKYYVREETTAGPLYFWPMPAVTLTYQSHGPRDITWTDGDGNPAERRGGYLITTRPVAELVAHWVESARPSHYARKAETDLSPVARVIVAASQDATFPERIELADWEGRCEYGPDSDCHDCTWHQVRGGIYKRVLGEPTPRSHAYSVADLEELDIYEPDPAPDRQWVLASPNLAAFYPQPAHHQFPGELTGVFDDIAEAVRAAADEIDIHVTVNVYASQRTISVSADIPWDEPLPFTPVPGRSKRARELTRERQRAATVAMKWWGRDERVPTFVSGETKAEALQKRDAMVAAMVAKLVPPHTRACEKCHGFGYVE